MAQIVALQPCSIHTHRHQHAWAISSCHSAQHTHAGELVHKSRRSFCDVPRRLQCCAAAPSASLEVHSGVRTAGTPLHIMIAGAPAAGKGTQCQRIVEKFGLVHVSAGDLLREEVAAGTSAGQRAKGCMDEGRLVPNEVVVGMVKARLAREDAEAQGWLLDGYPRSAEQAEAIEEVPDEELVERVTGRRLDPATGEIYHLRFRPPPEGVHARLVQRSDDTEDKLRTRLATHHANVAAVVGYYKDVLVQVDGARPMDEVFANIDGVLSAFVEDHAPAEAAVA